MTTKQDLKFPYINPTGKGGFGDNPQNRSNGRWSKENSFSYWLNFFKNLTVAELKEWLDNNPENVRTVAANLAYARVAKSVKSLKEFQEVANRSEGLPIRRQEITGKDGEPLGVSVTYVDALKMINDKLNTGENGVKNEDQSTNGESQIDKVSLKITMSDRSERV